jgi:deazaflavin-dependent oxidoreductase (nitroreductase family)
VSAHARAVRRLGHQRWFAALARRFAPLDRRLLRATRGRLGLTGRPVYPTLLLTTTGRRSGRPRTTPVMYVRDGASFVVTSQSFGQSRPAAWPLNLDADPRALAEVAGVAHACRARRLDEAEADRLWPRFVEVWPAHETYLRRSGVRHMYALEPSGGSTP